MFQDVGKLEDSHNRLIIKRLIKEIGQPRNYGLTDEEKAEEERKIAEERMAREAMVEAEREHKEAVETAEKIARWEEWVSACAGRLLCAGLCVCMRVQAYVYAYVCRLCVCLCAGLCVCTRVQACACVQADVYACMCRFELSRLKI